MGVGVEDLESVCACCPPGFGSIQADVTKRALGWSPMSHGGDRPSAGSERRDEILAIAARAVRRAGLRRHHRPRDRRRRRHPLGQPLPPLRLEGVDGRRAACTSCSTESLARLPARSSPTGDDPEVALRALVREAFAAIATDARDGRGDGQRVEPLREVPALRVPARRSTRRPSGSGWACSNAAAQPARSAPTSTRGCSTG